MSANAATSSVVRRRPGLAARTRSNWVVQPGPLRDQAGRQRDAAAQRRDEDGFLRDEAANARDRAAGRPGEHRDRPLTDVADPRVVPAADSDREHARRDRVAAANDRADAALDRQKASADRTAAALDRRQACLDGLTGAFNREAGLLELGRDLARAARTEHMLVVMFVDVDHLKALNDTHGHAAGDRALIAVAETLLGALRPYDLVIRYGGDEFLCAVEGIDTRSARLRFAQIDRLLDEAVEGLTITVGLAQLQTGESSDDVIARADADLYRQRHQRSH